MKRKKIKMAQAIYPPRNAINDIAEQQLLLQRPEVSKMVDLDRSMANILSRRDLSAEQRAKEYHKALLQFDYTRNQVLLNGTQLQPNISASIAPQLGDVLMESERAESEKDEEEEEKEK